MIAGQGTAAKELIEEVGAARRPVRLPRRRRPALRLRRWRRAPWRRDCKVYGVEPEAGNDGQQSFRSGGRSSHIDDAEDDRRRRADPARSASSPSPIIRRDVDDILTATDAELVEAMRFFAERMKMVVEPTGCLGFAAARGMAASTSRGQRVGVIISGGNVDLARFAALTGRP